MEYTDPNRRGRYIVILGVILALVAGGAAFFLINQAQQQAGRAGLSRVQVVVAARDIPARKPIEPSDLTLRDVPIDPTNERGIFADPQLVIGRVLAVTVLTGQLVTSNMLASTTTGSQFSILDPSESFAPDSVAWRAISLSVPDDRALGGLLQPNDTVDVFVTITVNVPQSLLENGRYYTDRSTKIMYQDMVILTKVATNYIVRARIEVAEEIAHLQASGTAQFTMALRPDVDTRVADATILGATTNMLLERYGVPIPQVFPPGRGAISSAAPTPTSEPAASPVPSASAAP